MNPHYLLINATLALFATLAAPALGASSGLPLLGDTLKLQPMSPNEQTTPVTDKALMVEERYSANDFYYYQGQRMPLDRSLNELVLWFPTGLPKQARQAAASALAFPTAVIRESRVEGREFTRVKLQGIAQREDLEQALNTLQARTEVTFVSPVFISQETGTRLFLTEEIVIKLKPGVLIEDVTDAYSAYGLAVARKQWGTQDEYVLQVQDPKAVSPMDAANKMAEGGLVVWAEPNFVQDYQRSFTPNDSLFPNQWHLNNTGQGGFPAGADVNAPEAWDMQMGSADITIAVIDDGVQRNHPDLQPNIFVNPGEIPGNSIDDDSNGYVDDVNGWDFRDNDNDPNPTNADDNHGTAVAGVAAAKGNNATGVSGACLNCRILPLRLGFGGGGGSPDTAFANAIRYGASLADVLNNSWGGGTPSATIQSAIQDATTTGRGGKGAVVLFATGNSASGYRNFTLSGFPAGTHKIIWEYSKDLSWSAGNDTVWLAWVQFPGGEWVNFQGGTLPSEWTTGGNPSWPSGWTTGGNQPWSVVTDPSHADEGMCLTRAAKSGAITDSQVSWLHVIKSMDAGSMRSSFWISSEAYFDGLRLIVDLNNDGSIDYTSNLFSGVPNVHQPVSYPAAFPEAIAVGASTNLDCRSRYSQYGPELDFVAPSNGSNGINLDIVTTDRTGAAGYNPNDYSDNAPGAGFSGTSSACPLASGVAGLILSDNPNLTQVQVRQCLRDSADKVGPEPYVGGRNDRYGYGRINAEEALNCGIVPPQIPWPWNS